MKNKISPEIIAWAKAAGIRALKTAAQTAVSILGVATVLQDVDWMMLLSASALAALMSLLTSIAGIPEAGGGAPLHKLMDTPTTSDEEEA